MSDIHKEKDEEKDHGFSLITFNVMHPDFVSPERYAKVDENHLAWEYRRPLISSILKREPYDVILLQEMDYLSLDHFREEFPAYHIITQENKKRDKLITRWQKDPNKDEQKKPNTMVVVTMLLKDRFSIQSQLTKTRSLTVLVTDLLSDTNNSLTITNVHLDAQRNDSDAEALRLKHLQSIVECLTEQKEAHHHIICGDFNDVHSSPTLQLLEDQHYVYGYKKLPIATYYSMRSKRKETLDHLFHSASLKVTAEWDAFSRHIFHMPSHEHPSDHIPIVFRIRKIKPV